MRQMESVLEAADDERHFEYVLIRHKKYTT